MLRDIVQNHMMQLLSLVAMEPPVSLAADAIHDEKVKVLQSIRPFQQADFETSIVRGQYGPGLHQRSTVVGYRQEKNVSPPLMSRPMRHCAFSSTTGVGLGSLFIYAEENACPNAPPRSPSSSKILQMSCSNRRTNAMSPIRSRCAFSPTKGLALRSTARSLGLQAPSSRSRWTSATVPTSE